jgi:hypothetical protein
MYRRFDQLSQVLQEMQDRYGPADPLVTQLQEAILQLEGVTSKAMSTPLPFGERRSESRISSYWNVNLRNSPHALQRRDVLVDCKRVMQRANGRWN